MSRYSFSLALCCLAFVCSCVPTTLVPVSDSRFTAFESDEMRLWNRSAEQVRRIDESGFLYRNDILEDYLNEVAKKLQPKTVYQYIPFHIKVIKSPYLNAFALPNGAIYVHTGLLASMENEAQLAALLGHEMTHATNRHSAMKSREAKQQAAALGVLIPVTGGLAAVFGTVALEASVYGYSRELEREADREGFALFARAGYDPAESVALFEQMKREIEEEKTKEPFFFGTHPRITERIDSFRELIKGQAGSAQGVVRNADVFRPQIKQLILDNARLNIQTGRYEKADSSVRRYLESYPNDAEANYLLGEASRQRGGEYDKKAQEYYRTTLSIDADHADSHKMLGIMLLKAGDKTAARHHLEKYLALNTKAPDRAYVEEYIRRCDQPFPQE